MEDYISDTKLNADSPPGPAHGVSELDRYQLSEAILAAYKKYGKDAWCSIADEILPLIEREKAAAVASALEQRGWPKGTAQFEAARVIGEREMFRLAHASAGAELTHSEEIAKQLRQTIEKLQYQIIAANAALADLRGVEEYWRFRAVTHEESLATALRERDEANETVSIVNKVILENAQVYTEKHAAMEASLSATKAALANAIVEQGELRKDKETLTCALEYSKVDLAAKQQECEELLAEMNDPFNKACGCEEREHQILQLEAELQTTNAQLTAEQQAHEKTKAELKDAQEIAYMRGSDMAERVTTIELEKERQARAEEVNMSAQLAAELDRLHKMVWEEVPPGINVCVTEVLEAHRAARAGEKGAT